MGPDYFKKAIKIMRQQISRPIFLYLAMILIGVKMNLEIIFTILIQMKMTLLSKTFSND